MKTLEREIKVIIPNSELPKYKQILENLAWPKETLQVNYYFDTEDFSLEASEKTLRIRQKHDKLMLQYKYYKSRKGAVRECTEFEREVVEFPKFISSILLPDYIVQDEDTEYKYVGSLVTKRVEYVIDGTIVSLDENYYLGKYDCEIEVESKELSKAQEVLGRLSIQQTSADLSLGKYSRFVREYKRLMHLEFP